MVYIENREYAGVFNDMGGGVWIAAKGSTLPVTLDTDPAAPFKPVGWLSEDGISYAPEKDIEEYHAAQGGSLIRKKVTKVGQAWTFTCLEGSELVTALVYSGNAGVVTGVGAASISTRAIGSGQNVTVERAIVLDAVDGAVRERTCVSAVDIAFSGEVAVLHGTDMRTYEFTATLLAGATATIISNAPGLVAVP